MNRVTCQECDGEGTRFGDRCVPCKGTGKVFVRPERDSLVEAIAEACGSSTEARAVVDALDAYRATLIGWLVEAEILVPTGWALERVGAVRPDLAPWHKDHRPESVRVVGCDPGPNPDRLYRLVVQ